MKAYLECVPCIISQALRVARLATNNPVAHRKVMEGVLKELAETDLGCTPFELGQIPQRVVADITGVADPYPEIRRESNARALELYPRLRAIVEEADDPLHAAAKIAAAGNIIDFGAVGEGFDIEATLEGAMAKPFGVDHYAAFRQAAEAASSVLYLADNAGEIVFDRVLIEELPVDRVIVAVRGEPFLNDAMLDDADEAGITALAEVIAAPLYPARSDELEEAWGSVDMIISKGQANYESYSEWEGPLFFLLIAKCDFTAKDTGVSKGDTVLLGPR
ncbi:MAG TPA: ARMT1-like domain-containing protein [Armatimonadota bacterium]|jgi:hypothetical protein|nr:ARMT1-like domain-containing protein [Armatimonadota bacterium]